MMLYQAEMMREQVSSVIPASFAAREPDMDIPIIPVHLLPILVVRDPFSAERG